MKNPVILITLLFIFGSIAFSQNQPTLPTLKTTTNKLDVKEGENLQKGIWELSRDVELDIYDAENKNIEQTITFYSDIDSLSFKVKPDSTYDFIILLNGKDKFPSRISTKYNTYRKDCNNCVITSDSIPFEIERDNRILIKGKVNDGESLGFLFDTGAEESMFYKSGFNKMPNLKFAGTSNLVGGGGQVTAQFSLNNKLQISGLIWDRVIFDYAGQQLHDYDGLIGYKIFEGKVAEINYDKKEIAIHSEMFDLEKSYSKANFKRIRNQYFIELTLQIGDREINGWFGFDTGSSGTLNISSEFAKENNLYNSMKKIGESSGRGVGPNTIKNDKVTLPKLKIGEYELSELPIFVEQPPTKEYVLFSVVGSDILKRFNWVIDFKNNAIYLKPNNLFNQPFKK
jgi:Aspartyl protease